MNGEADLSLLLDDGKNEWKVIMNFSLIQRFLEVLERKFLSEKPYKFGHGMKGNNLENNVVAFATDSIAVRKKISNLGSEELGDMKLDNEAHDVIFLSNGFYRFKGAWKKRGIGYDNEKKQEIEHEDTLVDKDGMLYIKVKTTRNTHIKRGILFNKLKDVGKIEECEKKINLNSDKKRFWLSELKSLNDGTFCDSVSIPIDLVGEIGFKRGSGVL